LTAQHDRARLPSNNETESLFAWRGPSAARKEGRPPGCGGFGCRSSARTRERTRICESKIKEAKTQTFRYAAPTATSVMLVGDFTECSRGAGHGKGT